MKLMDVVGLFLRRAMESENWDEAEEEVMESMLSQGYDVTEINVAISVVQRLREQIENGVYLSQPIRTNRVFQMLEELRLTREARGYLLKLVHSGVITSLQREEIVEKALLVDAPEIGFDEIQYVTQMVLAGENFGTDNAGESASEWYH